MHRALGEIEDLLALTYLDVGELRTNCRRDIAAEGPRCCRPHQQGLPLSPTQREAQRHTSMGQFLIAIRDDLVLTDPGSAAPAPGHDVGTAIEPATFPTLFEERPDHVIIFVGERKITAPQFWHAQTPHDLFYGVGHGSHRTL